MKLSEQRCLFTLLLARLVIWVHDNLPGHALAFDQVKRDPETARANAEAGIGISNSLHLSGLAADMLLYIDGVYTADTNLYREIGEQWEKMHTLNRWGGRFKRADGNHFSSTRGGIQ